MRKIELTEGEYEFLRYCLRTCSDTFSTAGCNDYRLPDTPQNRAMARAAYDWSAGEDREPATDGKGNLVTEDSVLIGYLQGRCGLDEEGP